MRGRALRPRLTFRARHAAKSIESGPQRQDEMDRTKDKRAGERLPTRPAGQDEEDGTRDRILKTAERMFAERGFNGVSVRELAGAASVNIASIGYHFSKK